MKRYRYDLVKNSSYAMAGLHDMLYHEKSFQIELILFVLLQLLVYLIPFPLGGKAILSSSLWIPLIAEAINSAIERVVDLYTLEYHSLAKRAKDVGSTIVLLSILLMGNIWAFTLLYFFIE